MSDPILLALVAGAVRLVLLMIMSRARTSGGAGARGGITVVRVRAGTGPVVIDYRAGEGTLVVYLQKSSEAGLRRKDER
ncbi:hypothetical protein [Streptosporangium sp. NPDC006007]|uniref:hypothetical protein n=1 Tax=Streptosporangium sp. NPDC006007 TaxID=3154575 RepID=UPI0033B920C8